MRLPAKESSRSFPQLAELSTPRGGRDHCLNCSVSVWFLGTFPPPSVVRRFRELKRQCKSRRGNVTTTGQAPGGSSSRVCYTVNITATKPPTAAPRAAGAARAPEGESGAAVDESVGGFSSVAFGTLIKTVQLTVSVRLTSR